MNRAYVAEVFCASKLALTPGCAAFERGCAEVWRESDFAFRPCLRIFGFSIFVSHRGCAGVGRAGVGGVSGGILRAWIAIFQCGRASSAAERGIFKWRVCEARAKAFCGRRMCALGKSRGALLCRGRKNCGVCAAGPRAKVQGGRGGASEKSPGLPREFGECGSLKKRE